MRVRGNGDRTSTTVIALAIVAVTAASLAIGAAPSSGQSGHASDSDASFRYCGTRQVYGHEMKLRVRGKGLSCARVKRIVSGRCSSEKKWTCFSFHVPAPFLVWFPSKDMFKRHFTKEIDAIRHPCSEARLSRRLWNRESRPFPTRRQLLSDDIVRCGLLEGKTIAGVERILGKTRDAGMSHGHAYRDYAIGDERDSFFQIDQEMLSIRFSRAGIFRSAEIFQS